MPVEPNETVVDGVAIRERVREGVRLLDALTDKETVRDTVLLLDRLLLEEGKGRIPEPVALLVRLRERLPETLGEAWTESDGVILSPKDPLRDGLAGFDREAVSDTDMLGVFVEEHDMKTGLQERVTLTVGALLLDTLALREADGGMAEPVELLDTLLDDETKTYAVLLGDDDTVMLRDEEADTLLALLREIETEGVAVEEQDMKTGLQERVTLTVGALLLDTLALGEDDGRTPEPVGLLETLGERLPDLLFEA